MKRSEIKYKHAPHLTYRDVDQKRDFDDDGQPLPAGYVAIVRRSQIKTDALGSHFSREALEAAPCIPGLSHSQSNKAYGRWRRRKTGRWFWVQTKPTVNPAQLKAAEAAGDDNPEGWEQQWFDTYWTCPVYLVKNGWVYRGTIQHHSGPEGA